MPLPPFSRPSTLPSLIATMLLSPVAHAAPTISPDLAAEMQHTAADTRIPVIIVMQEQVDSAELLPIAQRFPTAERRAFATTELRSHAETKQVQVRAYLQTEAANQDNP